MSETNRVIAQFGAVAGLSSLASSGRMSQDNAQALLSGYLGDVMLSISTESDSEIRKLTAANERIKAIAQRIKASPRMSFTDSRINELHNAARAFDGWTVSLLETDYKFMGVLEGTMVLLARTTTLATGLNSLMSQKFKEESLFAAAKTRMVF